MDLPLHSNINLDGSFSFLALNTSYAFPFMALYITTQQACLLRALYTGGSILSDLSPSESFAHRRAYLPIYGMDQTLVALYM